MKNFINLICVTCFAIVSLNASELLVMGKGSYGNPKLLAWDENTRAIVGRYSSIADEVTFILGGEHRIDWVTTYPFSAVWEAGKSFQGHPKTKGDIIIGSDVWIGRQAMILSGVTIGDGAVVGARAVVTKNVPAYAIVGGNPAKIIRYRFDEETRNKLLEIKWWNWSRKKLVQALPYLLSSDIETFIEYSER